MAPSYPKRYKRFQTKYTRVKTRDGKTRTYVPRSLGNPRAVTERKYYDVEAAVSLNALTTTWAGGEADPTTLNTLFVPVTGDDYNNRTGRKVSVIALKIRGYINCSNQIDQTAAEAPNVCRVIVVLDQQTNATQLNAEDVITSGAGSQAINMFQNPAFFGRFKVLKDKRMVMQNPAITFDGTNVEQNGINKSFEWIFKFKKPIVIHFNATNGATVADIVDKSFHIIAGATSVSMTPILSYKCRTTFLDF